MTARAREAEKRATARRRARASTPTGLRVSASGVRFGLFCFTYLRQTKGRWAQHPLAMEPWQLETFSELLEVERDAWRDLTLGDLALTPDELWARLRAWLLDVDYGGLRIHREGLLGLPKKNGKSTGSSGLALYLTCGDDEPGAEVYSLAAAKDQARIVFGQARSMVEQSPRLLEILRVYRDAIAYPSTDSLYKVLSADADVQEGINPNGAIADEIHAHKSRHLYDTVRSAMIAREQPLLVGITTGGITFREKGGKELNLLGDLYRRGAGARPKYQLRKLAPELERLGHKTEQSVVVPRKDLQRSFYFKWFEVPWAHRESPRYWRAANPMSYLDDRRLQDEADVERPRGIFYRYHCNITTRVEKHWLPAGKLVKCRSKKPAHRLHAGDGVVAAIDVGLGYDTAALAVLRPPPLEENDRAGGRSILRGVVWGVHDDPKLPPPPAHFLQNEAPIDLDRLERAVRSLALGDDPDLLELLEIDGPLELLAVAGDPFKFVTHLQRLGDSGIVVVPFDQAGRTMVDASERLYRAVTKIELATNGDEVLEAHFDNATARDVGGGHFRLDKRAAVDKMDLAVASAMASHLATLEDVLALARPSFSRL